MISEKTSKSEEALRESEQRFRDLFDNVRVGFVRTTIKDGKILDANHRVAEMFGYASREDLISECLLSEHQIGHDTWDMMLTRGQEGGEINNLETCFTRQDGTTLWVRCTGRVHTMDDFFEGVLVDITEQKLMVKALRESEETARALLNAAAEKAVLLDTEMVILAINQTWAQRIGKNVNDLIGRTLDELEPSEVAQTKEMFDAVNRSGKPLRFLGNREGRILDNQLYPIFDKDGKITRVAIFSRDITDQKHAEMALHRTNEILFQEHLKIKHLSKNLINLLEEDRRHIAMELHDQIGQGLTTLKMDLEMILDKLGPTGGILKTKTESAIEKALQTIKDIKEISAGLRPSVLDNLGLVAAVNELCSNIKLKAHVKIDFFARNIPQRIDPEKELAIYRIIQEALTNVAKHSKANEAFVNLVKRGKAILASVEDDGVGFDIDKVTKFLKEEKGSLGLLIMEERAIQVGGKLYLESRLGAGTHLSAEIPL